MIDELNGGTMFHQSSFAGLPLDRHASSCSNKIFDVSRAGQSKIDISSINPEVLAKFASEIGSVCRKFGQGFDTPRITG